MVGQSGLFELSGRYEALSAAGDPLERLAAVVDFEVFRWLLVAAVRRSPPGKGRRPPHARAHRAPTRGGQWCALRVEFVFAGQTHRMSLILRTIGIAPGRIKSACGPRLQLPAACVSLEAYCACVMPVRR